MNDSELKRWVREEIARQIIVITSGTAGDNTAESETIDSLYPGSPSIPTRPVMHPYGFASRALKGSIQVTAKVGADPSNRMVLGHRDSKRPADLETGESVLYSSEGYQLRAMLDGLRVVKGDKKFALLLGEDLIAVLAKIIDVLVIHTHGPPGTPPTNAADFTNIKTQDLAGTTLLSTQEGGL